ncbi:MAG: HPF/RaiA family ribosome-associated protein [Bacteroidota bacterium]|nr:HPF/RaiA family ribosome-associated protein [Bacteroidota bacterium]
MEWFYSKWLEWSDRKDYTMNYTENFEGIKIDVQAVDIDIDQSLQKQIRDMIVSLRRHISDVNWVDVYFKEEAHQSTNPRTFSMRFGIPGNDAFASDSGDNWLVLMKNVEEKLRRQLRKR